MYDFDRLEDALKVRAEQVAPDNLYPYIAGVLLSMVEFKNSIEDTTKGLEKSIQEHTGSYSEQMLVDLMWQHEPLDKSL
jgi:hypothetical protein